MIKQAHRMLDLDALGDVSPIYVQPYLRAYQEMDKIVKEFFGTRVVDEDEVVDPLKELVVAYMCLNITVTLKMDILFNHQIPALSNPVLLGRGLGVL